MAKTRVEGLISRAELFRRLSYDPRSGRFLWKVAASHQQHLLNQQAGSIYNNGYRYIEIDGIDYRAARLAWFYMTGEWPTEFVDHANGVKADDSILNLRLANNSQNQANRGLMTTNTSGVKGVTFEAKRNKWRAAITIDGKSKNLGRYKTKEEAMLAYATAAEDAWGKFAQFALPECDLAGNASSRL